MRFRTILLTLLALLLTACSTGTPTSTARAEPLVETAWLADHLDDTNLRLLDLSSQRATYDKGHIPGARYSSSRDWMNPDDPIPGQVLDQQQLETLLGKLGITPQSMVVLYDDNRGLNSTRVFWAMKLYGHEDVRILNGGRQKWLRENRAMTLDAPTIAPATYRAKEPNNALRLTSAQVLARLGDAQNSLVDARSPNEFTGIDLRTKRGGHIPGAVNVEWSKAMRPDDTFKSVEELRALYGNFASKNITTYCQTGVRGAHTWFVLSYLLGYDMVALYDGSWEEWGNRSDLPIE